MNYTYLPSSPYTSSPSIIMTTNPSSRKTYNLVSNPNVSLLVHDWVSHRPPTAQATDSSSPPSTAIPEQQRSSLAMLLANLNSNALSSISATINGEAKILEQGTEEEKYFKERHIQNNTFQEGGMVTEQDGGRKEFIEGEEVRVVVVKIKDGRVADWKGAIRDWSLVEDDKMVNGV